MFTHGTMTGDLWIRIIFALAAQYACALLDYVVATRVRSRPIGGVAVTALGVAATLAAMILPDDTPFVRFMVGVIGLLIALRGYSFWHERRAAPLAAYMGFISFGLVRPHLVYARQSPQQSPRRQPRI